MRKNAHYFITALFVLIVSSGVYASEMRFVDLSNVDYDALRSMSIDRTVKRLGNQRHLTLPKDSRSTAQVISALNIETKTLLGFVTATEESKLGPKAFLLPLAGRDIEFLIVDVVWDSDFQTFHIAAVSLEQAGDYIRLSVDKEGSRVVGTAHVDGRVYRIVPDKSGVSHDVHRVANQRSAIGGDKDISLPKAATRAERRHVQLAEIADLQPREFITSKDGRLSHIIDDDLGKMDLTGIGRLGEADPSTVVALASRFLKEHRALIGIHEAVDLQLQYVTSGDPKTGELDVVSFDQSINGIPVEGAGYDFTIEPLTGTVVAMGRTLATGDNIETDRTGWYTREEALQLALNEVSALYPASGSLQVMQGELRYRWVSDIDLDPFWRFVVRNRKIGHYIVHVNALNGSVSARPEGFHFGHKVCRPSSKGCRRGHPAA